MKIKHTINAKTPTPNRTAKTMTAVSRLFDLSPTGGAVVGPSEKIENDQNPDNTVKIAYCPG